MSHDDVVEQWATNQADQAAIAAEVLEERWAKVDEQATLTLVALGPLAVDNRFRGEYDAQRAVKAILASGYSDIKVGVQVGSGPWAQASRPGINLNVVHQVWAVTHDHGEALERLAGVCEGDATAASDIHYNRGHR